MAKRKAANGTGTIYQRKDGKWCGQYCYVDDLGITKRKTVYGSTQKDVAAKIKAATAAIDIGTYQPAAKKRWTVSAWLDEWIAVYCTDLKPNTVASYKSKINTRIKPKIGTAKLTELKPVTIQRYINSLSEELSPKSIKNIHGILHKALDQAVRNDLIVKNPASGTKLPQVKKADLHPLMDTDLKAFINALEGSKYKTILMLTLFTGMRESEIIGLQWRDIDMDTGIIQVRRQVQADPTKKDIKHHTARDYIILDETKNGKTRTVAVPGTIIAMLKQHERDQKKLQLAAGDLWHNPDGYVFTDEVGNHVKHRTLYKNFKDIVTSIGCPDVRFHDLRHSCATMMLQAGVPVKTVSDTLGHYSAAFTMDVYADVSQTMQQESQTKMETFIQNLSVS